MGIRNNNGTQTPEGTDYPIDSGTRDSRDYRYVPGNNRANIAALELVGRNLENDVPGTKNKLTEPDKETTYYD